MQFFSARSSVPEWLFFQHLFSWQINPRSFFTTHPQMLKFAPALPTKNLNATYIKMAKYYNKHPTSS
jgi:hypothetical protein